ncbi:hypothetical protein [Acinetobacter sp.]|uniref:hypothetical protein n=1 Tax=Acinetobacter sp. TaxID=472 RepID=UPI002FD9AA2A
MNTAADLRRFNDNQALEKAITNVMAALEKEPLGLEISQLMTVCRLSNRTTKIVLNVIRAECTDGVWFLDPKRKLEAESSLKAQTILAGDQNV